MRIAILGYGRMGRQIEQLAIQNGKNITLKANSRTSPDELVAGLKNADVAIDFTIPDVAFDVISAALDYKVPVISGTTAWLDRYDEVARKCYDLDGAFLYASNFSVGVNILFELNKRMAEIINNHPQYKMEIEEIHHTNKLDAPSGTAISIANDLIAHSDQKTEWVNRNTTEPAEIPIISKREPNVKGTHIISYKSEIDDLVIKHEAHSREGFARGALLAAEWIQDKQGVFTMKDVLSL